MGNLIVGAVIYFLGFATGMFIAALLVAASRNAPVPTLEEEQNA